MLSSRMLFRTLAWAWACASAVAACGGTPPVGLDAGRRDAGDAASTPADGGSDATVGIDGGPPMPTSCTVLDAPALELGTDGRGVSRAVSVLGAADRFHVLWVQSPIARDEIRLLDLPTQGAVAGAPVLVADAPLVGSAAAVAASGGWIVVWDDTALGGFEVRSAFVASDGTASAPARLTNNALRDDTPSVVAFGPVVLAGWMREDGAGGRALFALPLSATGEADGTETRVLDADVAAVTQTQSDLAATWALPVPGGSQVMLQELTPAGALMGSGVRLDTEANGAGAARIASASNRSAAVFTAQVAGARAELRFQSLDENGQPDHVERVLTPSPETGTGPGIAPLAGGWIVAYRTSEASPRIRGALVSPLGDVVASFDVAPAAPQGGPVAVAVAGDGRILVSWVDVASRVGTVRAARIACGD